LVSLIAGSVVSFSVGTHSNPGGCWDVRERFLGRAVGEVVRIAISDDANHGPPGDHAAGAPALGLRVQVGGRTIAYSGDTAWTDTLIELADGADLFVCETYTATRRVPYHLDLPTVRANRHRLRCARLLLIHPGPDLLGHRASLGGDLDLADDGTVIELE